LPGWHTTISLHISSPGAVFSGFGMVLTLLIPLRFACSSSQDMHILRHIDVMCKVTLGDRLNRRPTPTPWSFSSPGIAEIPMNVSTSSTGHSAVPMGWIMMISCNTLVPQVFWFKWCRQKRWFVFIISILVKRRNVVRAICDYRDRIAPRILPSSWGYYRPTYVDICTYIGTFGLFLPVSLVHQISADDRYLRGQRRSAQADPHHPAGGAKVEEAIPDDE